MEVKDDFSCDRQGDSMVPLSSIAEIAAKLPKTIENLEQVEQILETEMASLSLENRDKILFDLHGFAERGEEDENDLDDLLAQMDAALGRSRTDNAAYLQAKYLGEAYVTDRKFRLMFIRGERYDPKLAAERLLLHFTIKQELFGSGDILVRDIRLSDLCDDDMETLESGFLQVFPTRDAAGRTIFSFTPAHLKAKSLDNLARAIFYVYMTSLASDEELRKKGFVMILYGDNPLGFVAEIRHIGFVLKGMQHARLGIPKKLAGCHFCGISPTCRPILEGIRIFLKKEIRTRMRVHNGSYSEVIFKLQTFGIKAEDHPITPDGTLCVEWHQEWLRLRKAQEEQTIDSSSSSVIGSLVPRRFDALFGRGKYNREHTGNLRASHLVSMYQNEYENASKYEKTGIAEHIMNIVHDSYGRFLKWDDDHGWAEVDNESAREKVSHFFRQNRVPKNSSKPKKQQSERKAAVKRGSPGASPEPSE